MIIFLTFALGIVGIFRPAYACTTFGVFKPEFQMVGKSYDFYIRHGRLITNKRGVEKRSLVLRPQDKAANWISTHGSLTFNQFGREFPNGGMNDAGLVVEIMWLDESIYPTADDRETLNELQWIQYMLDTQSTVAGMVAAAPKIRVSKIGAPVHYLACDVAGECGTFEYLNGELRIESASVIRVLTNDPYSNSVEHLKNFSGFGGSEQTPTGISSLDRFVRAATRVKGFANVPQVARKQMFSILDSVKNPNPNSGTQWQIVYDNLNRKVAWRTQDQENLKSLNLGAEEWGCGMPVKSLPIHFSGVSEDVTDQLQNLTEEENSALVQSSIQELNNLPIELKPKLILAVQNYPKSTTCAR